MLVGLVLALAPWPEAWPQGIEPKAQEAGRGSPEGRLRIAVEQGRLSVDLRKADIQMVLAKIGEQAGFAVVGPVGQQRISVKFTGVELEKGLQRLLRLASLSHVIRYAQSPTGTVAIQEVRVFREEKGGAPLEPNVAGRGVEKPPSDVGQSPAESSPQMQAASPPPAGGDEGEPARRCIEMLGRAAQGGQ
jgi:hypothetical protein